jgi:Fe-S cluster biogenesis protein NfuA
MTLKAGIERILRDKVPGVTEVVDANADQFEGTPLSL